MVKNMKYVAIIYSPMQGRFFGYTFLYLHKIAQSQPLSVTTKNSIFG